MDKGLQEVIAKLKAQKPNIQQTSKPIEKPVPQAEVLEDENEDETDAEFYEDTEQKSAQKPSKEDETIKKAELEMELLNNNGRFRAELLFQLQELNKALVVIAQVLMEKK